MSRNVKEIKIVIVEALIKEEGEVTAERMLYAYHRIRERLSSLSITSVEITSRLFFF